MQQVDVAELLNGLLDVADLVRVQISDVLAGVGLTEPLAMMVWLLDPDADPQSMGQLAGRLRCDPSNVTLMVSRLEQGRLAERRQDPKDRRIRVVALTGRGQRVRADLLDRLAAATPLRHLDGSEQDQLRGLVAKIRAGASTRDPPQTPDLPPGRGDRHRSAPG